MKKIINILSLIAMLSAASVDAAPIHKESLPKGATEEQTIVTENLIGTVLDKVLNGMGYSDAMAESNYIIFTAWLNGQTNGYAFGELAPTANNAIFQYRDMYLRPDFYRENEEKVKNIIANVITQYTNVEIDYATAEKLSREKIYQSINPNFDFETEMAKDSCYRDIPAVDSSLFAIARKLLLEK